MYLTVKAVACYVLRVKLNLFYSYKHLEFFLINPYRKVQGMNEIHRIQISQV